MEIKPLNNYIMVSDLAQAKKSGSLLTPDSFKQSTRVGLVLEVSDQVLDIKKGDVIMFTENTGHNVEGGRLMLSSDVLAKINDYERKKVE